MSKNKPIIVEGVVINKDRTVVDNFIIQIEIGGIDYKEDNFRYGDVVEIKMLRLHPYPDRVEKQEVIENGN